MTALADMDVRMAKTKARLKKMPKGYGGGHYTAIVDSKGGPHNYLNAAVPQSAAGSPVALLHTAICEAGCNHAYSHLMEMHARGIVTCCCIECREEAFALHAQRVQEEYGVDLGLKASELVDRRDTLSISDARGMHVRRKR